MTYQVKIEVFEGPFDLLLHLIAKRELDIYEVSLAAITEEYLDHLKHMSELDLEVATEFLVVAATLIEIKAARLLPGPPRDDEDLLALSERDVLIARLLEYRAFKDAAGRFTEMIEANEGYAGRSAGPGGDFAHLIPDVLAKVSPQRLADLAVRALTPVEEPRIDLSHITPIRVSVGDAAKAIGEMLRDQGRSTFRMLTQGKAHRLEIIVSFLALLELVKRGYADVVQGDGFGEIEATWIAPAGTSLEGLETEDEW
ncbi:MAG: ScpA family protein [Actinomycetota bacterium]|nr:segregation/condensation protein A [Actinomycetota bacterium]